MQLTTEIMEKTIKIIKEYGKFKICSMFQPSGVAIYVHNLFHFKNTDGDFSAILDLGWLYDGQKFLWVDD